VAANAADGYFISSGEGRILQRDAGVVSDWPDVGLPPGSNHWDNHLIAIPI
jgi:hypothetical protein